MPEQSTFDEIQMPDEIKDEDLHAQEESLVDEFQMPEQSTFNEIQMPDEIKDEDLHAQEESLVDEFQMPEQSTFDEIQMPDEIKDEDLHAQEESLVDEFQMPEQSTFDEIQMPGEIEDEDLHAAEESLDDEIQTAKEDYIVDRKQEGEIEELSGLFSIQKEDSMDSGLSIPEDLPVMEDKEKEEISHPSLMEDIDINSIKSSFEDILSETDQVKIEDVDQDELSYEEEIEEKIEEAFHSEDEDFENTYSPEEMKEKMDFLEEDNLLTKSYKIVNLMDDEIDISAKNTSLEIEEEELDEAKAMVENEIVQPIEEPEVKEELSNKKVLSRDLEEDIEELKDTGYEAQGFVYGDGVTSKTVPPVEKNMDISTEGKIDYDKIVGENILVNIDSIYDLYDLIKQMSETVFMIEVYAKTLPENLPQDVKRESVLSIVKASSINIDDLLTDAYHRIDVLNEVLEDIASKSEELDKENKQEIKDLEEKILNLKIRIEKRANYKKSQNAMIGYEIQRIVNIVEFIELNNKGNEFNR